MEQEQFDKLACLNQPKLFQFVRAAYDICEPERIFVSTDSQSDTEYIRRMALELKEEQKLKTAGHTCHFDGPKDQGRDKANTRYLLPPDIHLGNHINSMPREEGLSEVLDIFRGSMRGKTMIVLLYCLGPLNSIFGQLACQITDSFYVAHSENLLYRQGYEEFRRVSGNDPEIFRFLHSAGRLENGVCADIDKRRVYIDLKTNTVYSVNTQYGGNTMGLKKLAMRLGISKSLREGWLTEHMFIVGVHGKNERITYITGAYPSLCGKTSTAMLEGQTIVGDDIAYLKKINGEVHAVNVECGIFGIIEDVNPHDDPAIYKALTEPGEVIFSNVLLKDGYPYWTGMGKELPKSGINYAGEWFEGKKDGKGKEIKPSHPNARFTIRLQELPNCDPRLDDPEGLKIEAMIFGGRDTDTSVPVEQAFNWAHGVITKAASLESETTAATLGQEGIREFNPMSNLDFLAASLDTYIHKYLEFVEDLSNPPLIFSVNYFLTGESGEYLTGMMDKKVWIRWVEERVHGETGALRTPTGLIPLYHDLKRLFNDALGKEYTEEQYQEQFMLRIPQLLSKISRIEEIYRKEWGIPEILFATLKEQRARLENMRKEFGDYISPLVLSQANIEGK
ncbi:MAG: phosphoenolpyruvate carboxykinase (GTP) [Actinomycetota bacterium]|nr:phosphoenolpyruvate carboxykinase (GTP) [Actinomycetota bacterium]